GVDLLPRGVQGGGAAHGERARRAREGEGLRRRDLGTAEARGTHVRGDLDGVRRGGLDARSPDAAGKGRERGAAARGGQGPRPAEGGPLRQGARAARHLGPARRDGLRGRPAEGGRGARILAVPDPEGPRPSPGRRGGGFVTEASKKRVPLYAMAHARSGDKGDGS